MHSLQSIRNINAWAAERARAAAVDRSNEVERELQHLDRQSVRYEGHHADGSSIQKHSAGPDYPFVVFEKGDNAVAHVTYGDVTVMAGSRETASHIVAAARTLHGRSGFTYAEALRRAAPMFGKPVV